MRPPKRLGDGLHGVVEDEEIAANLAAGATASSTATTLIELANARGGPDNISVVVARVLDREGTSS